MNKPSKTDNLASIPAELRTPPLWLQYYLSPDPKRPEKKPRKHPCVRYATPTDRKANLRSLDYLLAERTDTKHDGFQRWIDKTEGFTYIDIDRVRDPETGAVQEWAQALIEELDTYCEVSASGKGFHLVARGTTTIDYHNDPDQVEIYSGNRPNKLLAMTGDVYDFKLVIESRQEKINELVGRAQAREFNKEAPLTAEFQLPIVDPPDPTHWRDVFHLGSELDQRPGRVFIKGILEEGITAIGSLSGVGKTWVGLSIAHALVTGDPLFGRFPVVEKVNVLYLVPEMGGRKFRERLIKMRLPQDGRFFCQTVTDGACDLANPFLLEAVNDMRPLVVLDTAIRFQSGEENSSTEQAQGLGAQIFNLINHGAASVLCMHHRSKGAAQMELSLENALRGTGDFGAMSDCVWGIEHARLTGKAKEEEKAAYLKESQALTRLYMECVKPRDMEPADPFVIQGRPYIDQHGDFGVLTTREISGAAAASADNKNTDGKDAEIVRLIENESTISRAAIRRITGCGQDRIDRAAKEKGWKLDSDEGIWVQEQVTEIT